MLINYVSLKETVYKIESVFACSEQHQNIFLIYHYIDF